MTSGQINKRVFAAAGVAIVFGVVTIISGGSVLFGGERIAQAAGETVSFVLWFNFLAGFLYMVSGFGLIRGKWWAWWLAVAILAATIAVFTAFGIHVFSGGAFELRTLGAMTFRTVIWVFIVWAAKSTDHRLRFIR